MNIGILPLRSGSKRIKDKNIKPFLGKPLFWWTANALENAFRIDYFVVSSDSQDYIDLVKEYNFSKARYHLRNKKLAQDDTTTESVVNNIIEEFDIKGDEIITLVQATSPWVTAMDIDLVIDVHGKYDYNSVFSVADCNKFVWRKSKYGISKSVNYDYMNRKRSQTFGNSLYIENGGIYTTFASNYAIYKNRLVQRIGFYVMSFWTAFEIDTIEDWQNLEAIMKGREEWN